jgi:hypothetical protein
VKKDAPKKDVKKEVKKDVKKDAPKKVKVAKKDNKKVVKKVDLICGMFVRSIRVKELLLLKRRLSQLKRLSRRVLALRQPTRSEPVFTFIDQRLSDWLEFLNIQGNLLPRPTSWINTPFLSTPLPPKVR